MSAAAANVGRILNSNLATSQYIGAVTMGVGMALMQGNELDPRHGVWMNAELADHHVLVHADTHGMEVVWLEEPAPNANPLGAKGLGEMGMVGTAVAIAPSDRKFCVLHRKAGAFRSLSIGRKLYLTCACLTASRLAPRARTRHRVGRAPQGSRGRTHRS